MYDVGRICMKIAGRDAGKIAVVIKKIDEKYVLIDGQTRRKKCNISHLEITTKTIEIKEDASNAEVVKALKDADIECDEKKAGKVKEKKERPKKIKKIAKEQIKDEKKDSKSKKEQKETKKDVKAEIKPETKPKVEKEAKSEEIDSKQTKETQAYPNIRR